MSQPRTRSQGLPDTEVREDIKESAIPVSSPTEGRMSQELQVKLEVLKLYQTQKDKERETSQMQPELTRSTSETLRPPSMILSMSRSNSVLGIVIPRQVSTPQYHIVPIHNSTVEDGKQKYTTGLTIPRNQENDETDLEVAEILLMHQTNQQTWKITDQMNPQCLQ